MAEEFLQVATQAPHPMQAAASKAHWNWRGLFLTVSLPHGFARTATAPDTVHPARGAAIVEDGSDEAQWVGE